jgi:hypothetical protein
MHEDWSQLDIVQRLRAIGDTRSHDEDATLVHHALPGHLCECCLDAPAERLFLAPWGGDMGICFACLIHAALLRERHAARASEE